MKAKVLAAAKADGLTATDVKKKFGVTPVTYYSWRKKSAAPAGRGQQVGSSSLDRQLRSQVNARIGQLLPEIIRSEIDAQLAALFGGSRKQVARRKKK
jgi:transposase-like protein